MANPLYSLMLITSIVLIYFAARQYYNTKSLLENGIRTKAKVVALAINTDSDGDTYAPVFEYRDQSDQVITFESKISSSPAAYDIGETADIIYLKDGEDRKIVSYWGLYRWTIILLSIASPLLIIGGGYFLYRYV